MAGEDNSDGLERAIVHGQPEARDVEGRRLLAAIRAKMFAAASESEPVEIGRYRISRRIGQGGMGVVYEAHDPELDRQVALKLVRSGPGGAKERPARLLREAQALALLSHPNVVPIYDAGRHAEQVFLAMAYIEGKTLDRWQAQLRPWPEVVKHYLAAGRGLAAAHAAGLVHRDFKPANVMLSDDGRVLVMDFGLVAGQSTGEDGPRRYDIDAVIARLNEARPLDQDDPAAWEALTRSGQIVGTYSYMPPEQQEGKAAEALADQFAYCTAFLEALQGEFPFVGDTPEELYESKRTGRFVEDPPRPDFPRRLRRVLLRGLSAQPDQRWPDLEALLKEVERSVARRRWMLMAAGAGVVALGAAGWALVGAQPGCDGRAELTSTYGPPQRTAIDSGLKATGLDYAPDVSERVQEVVEAYAEQWIRAYDHVCSLSDDRSAVLRRRRDCLEDRRRALGALVEVAQDADATVVEKVVDVAFALPPIERCADPTYLDLVIDWPEDIAEQRKVSGLRARVATAQAQIAAGRLERAGAQLDDLAQHEVVLGVSALRSELELALGQMKRAQGDPKGATETLEQAHFRAMGAGHYEVAATASTRLVEIYGSDLGQTLDARAWARHAQGPVSELGNDPFDLAHLDHARGLVFLQDKQYEAAAAAFERALEAFRARFGVDHPEVARAYASLGIAAEARAQFADAAEHHRQSVQVTETLVGLEHPNRADALERLVGAERGAGRTDEALSHARESLRIRQNLFGAAHPAVGASLTELGSLLHEMERWEDAADVRRRALAAVEGAMGRSDPQVAIALIDLAATLNRLERHLGAATALERASRILENRLDAGHPDRLRLASERAEAQLGQNDPDGARQTLEGAVESCRRRSDRTERCEALRASLAELEHPTETPGLREASD